MKGELKQVKISIEDVKRCIKEGKIFDLIEPMWQKINIYGSHDEYLKSAEEFTLEQRYLFAVEWYEAEVSNGGHHQFLFNSTGVVWKDAMNGFKLFGMQELAENFQKLIDYLGGDIPLERKKRQELLEEQEEEDEEGFFDFLDEIDDFYYNYNNRNEVGYFTKYPEKFVYEGEYKTSIW